MAFVAVGAGIVGLTAAAVWLWRRPDNTNNDNDNDSGIGLASSANGPDSPRIPPVSGASAGLGGLREGVERVTLERRVQQLSIAADLPRLSRNTEVYRFERAACLDDLFVAATPVREVALLGRDFSADRTLPEEHSAVSELLWGCRPTNKSASDAAPSTYELETSERLDPETRRVLQELLHTSGCGTSFLAFLVSHLPPTVALSSSPSSSVSSSSPSNNVAGVAVVDFAKVVDHFAGRQASNRSVEDIEIRQFLAEHCLPKTDDAALPEGVTSDLHPLSVLKFSTSQAVVMPAIMELKRALMTAGMGFRDMRGCWRVRVAVTDDTHRDGIVVQHFRWERSASGVVRPESEQPSSANVNGVRMIEDDPHFAFRWSVDIHINSDASEIRRVGTQLHAVAFHDDFPEAKRGALMDVLRATMS